MNNKFKQRTFRGAFLLVFFLLVPKVSADIFYEVTWPDRKVWLVGTIHLVSHSKSTLSEHAIAAIAESDYVWTEMTPNELARSADILFAAGMRAEPFLQEELEPELWQQLAALSARVGLAPSVLERMEPWLIEYVLMVMVLRAEDFDTRQGIDHQVFGYAEALNKTILGFENAEQQVEILEASAEGTAAKAHVGRILTEVDTVAEDLLDLERLWQAGDLETIYQQMVEPMSDYAEHVLLTERNQSWFRTLIAEIAEGETHYIAVGAAHLPGEQGLLKLFERAGAEVSDRSNLLPQSLESDSLVLLEGIH